VFLVNCPEGAMSSGRSSGRRVEHLSGKYVTDLSLLLAMQKPRFGISYEFETLPYRLILVEKGSHPLVEGVSYLEMLQNNGVSLTMSEGHMLAQEDGKVMAGLVTYGNAGGQVLALADVGMMGNAASTASRNLTFWQNLARYARSR
jgi:hypothetical protein